jgi:hypothetical protein
MKNGVAAVLVLGLALIGGAILHPTSVKAQSTATEVQVTNTATSPVLVSADQSRNPFHALVSAAQNGVGVAVPTAVQSCTPTRYVIEHASLLVAGTTLMPRPVLDIVNSNSQIIARHFLPVSYAGLTSGGSAIYAASLPLHLMVDAGVQSVFVHDLANNLAGAVPETFSISGYWTFTSQPVPCLPPSAF